MSRLLLQHWTGEIPEIVALSTEAMADYSLRIGADYLFIRGNQWDDRLSAPCNKLIMLSEDYDDYDDVSMVDADMFPVRSLTEDVFALDGFGIYHPEAHRRVLRHLPRLSSPRAAFWGGAIYRLPRSVRIALRREYDFAEARRFNNRGNGEDEGILHRLAMRAGIDHHPLSYFGQEWAWASYAADFTTARFIHIRHHNGKGKLVDKMTVHRDLKARGIL